MAQASSWWQQLVSGMQNSSLPEFRSRSLKVFSSYGFVRLGIWLLGLAVAIAMVYWRWQLLLATSVGVLVMLLVYRLQAWDWQVSWVKLRRFMGKTNRQLAIAVGSGGLATLSTYVAVSIGIDTKSSWIGVGALLQGLGTLLTLVLLVWQIVGRQRWREEAKLDRLLTDLSATEPLKRLIAVRQLTSLATKVRLDKTQQRSLAEYFRLMLAQEQEPMIRDAVLDGLQALDKVQPLNSGNSPLAIPLNFKPSATKVPHQTSS